MTELDGSDVKRIAREAARELSLPLEIVGVVMSGSNTDYVEILVTVQGCASEPCHVAVGVFRNASEPDLKDAITARLRRHLDEHHVRTRADRQS